MKRILLFSIIAFFGAAMASCGPHMYKTQSGGQDNVSYIIVLTEGAEYENVSVVVDDTAYPYGKVYKIKAKRKVQPIRIEPGRHNIKVVVNGEVATDENVFLALQETKTIVLR